VTATFCAICVDGTEDLKPGDDGRMECRRCREEHPIFGGYSFDQMPLRDVAPVGSFMPTSRTRRKGRSL
jgi:hypothetical protein